MERILQKIARIEEHLRIVEQLAPDCEKRFGEPLYRGALLHYLYLLADSSVSLAEMVISFKNLRPPQSYADSFVILGDNGILEKEFAWSFSKIAGFRNFLAHDYEQVDQKIICQSILARLEDISEFVAQIRKAL